MNLLSIFFKNRSRFCASQSLRFLLSALIYMMLAPCNYYTKRDNLSAFPQFFKYRYNIWLCWSELYAAFQHTHNFFRFLPNLSGGMLTCQHQMISGDCVFPLYVFFHYRKHILYQKCALPAVVQFNYMENIAMFPYFFFFSIIFLYLSTRLDNGIIQYIPIFVSSKQ